MVAGPGDDLLSQVLRHSTIGAVAFDGRVRDGIGSDHYAESHQAGEGQEIEANWNFYQKSAVGVWQSGDCPMPIA